jgi:thiosulfate dehydrogenase [quinone] large subunit
MNSNYLLSGAISANPLMILFGVLIMLAWRNAGWIGLDRRLLPAIGTPWQPGEVFVRSEAPPPIPAGSFRTDVIDGQASWRR